MVDTTQQNAIQSEREYVEFFDENDEYKDRISTMINQEATRLIININDLRREVPNRAAGLIDDSFAEIAAAEKALKRVIQNTAPDFAKKHDFHVGFEGSFGSKHVTPRTLGSILLGKMVCVEGIITKCSMVHPKIVRSVHYCPATNKTIDRVYTDITSVDAFPSSGVYPTKDEEGNLLETEYGLSVYKDHQSVAVQEMPETAPAGQLPRAVDIMLDNDLVDSCKPGDRVQVVGQYRCLPGKKNGYTTASFRSVVIANNVKQLSKDTTPLLSEKDISTIRVICRRPNIVKTLSASLAPSIHGHERVKQAILYQLLGGVERVLVNGSRIRGDINLLLMGDPSVAKSQFLRFVMQIAHRAINTTGRGSSGVGLTAAVTTDPETGERTLEAGAMVLADRGIVCIDEFDKMSDIDRTAIHEVMEQGRVTIAKAGIQAKLNARCSVLGAANPVYGRYDPYKTPVENIGLQDSLLSRFDLLFVLLDTAEEENDLRIAEHVLRAHRYRAPGEHEGEALPLQRTQNLLSTMSNLYQVNFQDHEGNPDNDANEDQVFEEDNFNVLSNKSRKGNKKNDIFTMRFLQKYIAVARDMKPKLTSEASTILAKNYCEIRQQESIQTEGSGDASLRRTQPITVRTLETLIRLATANAKARMSREVTSADADAAVELLRYVMFKEVLQKPKSRKRNRADDSGAESASDNDDTGSIESDVEVSATRSTRKLPNSQNVDMDVADGQSDIYAFKEDEPATSAGLKSSSRSRNKRSKILNSDSFQKLGTLVSKIFQEKGDISTPMSVNTMVDLLKKSAVCSNMTDEEIMTCLQKLDESNKIMVTDDEVYLI